MTNTGVPAVGLMVAPAMDSGRVHIVVGEKTDGRPVGGTTSFLVVR